MKVENVAVLFICHVLCYVKICLDMYMKRFSIFLTNLSIYTCTVSINHILLTVMF